MIVDLARDVRIDTDNIPDDFDNMIVKAFWEFTSVTAPECRYVDKLSFIDMSVRLLKGNILPETAVRKIIHDTIDSQLDECGTLPSLSDFDEDFYIRCYEEGQDSTRLGGIYIKAGSLEDKKIMEILCHIIKVVVNIDLK